MHARHYFFAAQIRRYKHLAKKLNRLLKSGNFQLLTKREQRSLLYKFQDRLKRIGHLMPHAKLKGALAGVALLLGTAMGNQLEAQTFSSAIISPFGIEPGTTYGYQAFADLDGDGDLDLLVNSYDSNYNPVFLFYENIGTPQTPVFTADNFEENPFGIEPAALSQPILVDLDNDGDLDLISGNIYGGGFQFQENIGTATAPDYAAPQQNPFGLSASNYFDFATATDLDNDGDIDILGGGLYGVLQYFENTGTPSTPSFAAPQTNPFGISVPGIIIIPHFCDLDGDGDADLLFMSYGPSGSEIYYAENTGTADNPAFNASLASPFGITPNGLEVPIPSSADIDADGDVDVFLNNYYGDAIHFYENLNINVDYPPTSADNTIIMPEDGIYIFQPDDFYFQDGNAGDQLQFVQITALPSNGLLKIGSIAANVNDVLQVGLLGNLNFDSDLNEFGNGYANFKFKVSDGGLFSVDDYTMTINVTPVNDAPTTQNTEVTASNDYPFIFEPADFPFADVDNTDLQSVKIMALPAKGSLKLSGNAVTVGQTIASAQIQDLSYSAIAGESGTAYTTFDFQVSDGSAFSATAAMTINVVETSSSTDKKLDAVVSLSPNPVGSELNIRIESDVVLNNPTIVVVDALGRTLHTERLTIVSQNIDFQLNTESLPAGFYFVKIEAEGKTSTLKFVKG